VLSLASRGGRVRACMLESYSISTGRSTDCCGRGPNPTEVPAGVRPAMGRGRGLL